MTTSIEDHAQLAVHASRKIADELIKRHRLSASCARGSEAEEDNCGMTGIPFAVAGLLGLLVAIGIPASCALIRNAPALYASALPYVQHLVGWLS